MEFLSSSSVLSTFLVCITTALLVRWLIQRMKYKYPPGPRGFPIIGNAFQINSQKLHQQVFEWSRVYGPVLTIRLGPIPFVFVNRIDEALEVLVKKSTDFAARMSTATLSAISYGGKDIAFSSYGLRWKLHRRISSKALRSYLKGGALEKRVQSALETAFAEIDKETLLFDPDVYVNFIVGTIMNGFCFGGKTDFGDEEMNQISHKMNDFIEAFGVGTFEDAVPWFMNVYKTKAFRKIEQLSHEVCEEFIRKKMNLAEQTFDRDNIRHFTDDLLLARLEAEEEEGKEAVRDLTEDHLIQTITDIFLAGIHTSQYTLTYAILHMIAYPDIQEKVQHEIDRVVGKSRLPGIDDRPNLGYTEAVLHESMRLSSILPTGLIHMTACDTDIGADYRIPKGTAVVINHWALHHDPQAWDEVDRFIPERFLDDAGKLGPKPKSWLPFSAGKRVCLGEFVAKQELHLIFASLMQRYKWKMESGRCPNLEPAGSSFFLSAKPYKVVVEKRV